jgi:hypothetical protein
MASVLKLRRFPHDPSVAAELMSDAGGLGMPKFERPGDGTGAETRTVTTAWFARDFVPAYGSETWRRCDGPASQTHSADQH